MARINHADNPNTWQPEEITRASSRALGNRPSSNSDAIGELLDLLMEKGLIDEDEVKMVLGLI